MKRRTFIQSAVAFLVGLFAPKRAAAAMPKDVVRTLADGTKINYSREYRKFLQNECFRLREQLPMLVTGVARWERSTTAEDGIKWLREIRKHLDDAELLSPSTDDVIAWLIRERRPFCEKTDAEIMHERMWA